MTKRILSFLLSFTLILGLFYGTNLSVFAEETPAEYFEYEVNDDGQTVTITGYTGTFSEVNIPSTIDGKDVTVVGAKSFYDCDNIIKIDIPDSVTSIGERAFYFCTALTEVTIPNSVTVIDNYVFYGCENLTNIVIPNTVKLINHGAFGYCTSLTSVSIPYGVISIADSAFYKCTSISNITIPDSVTSIGNSAFCYCKSLTSITIPDSVMTINGYYTFSGCTNLTSIDVDENNSYFSSTDGVLFNKSKTTLIKYPEGKTNITYEIPNTVINLSDNSFYSCKNIKNITMTDSVTNLGSYVFFACTELSNITLSNNIKEIPNAAFFFCSPENVYYLGTEEEWNLISIDVNNDSLLNATRYYGVSGEEDINPFDIMVSSAKCTQATPSDGDQISFYTTIRNIGDNTTSGGIRLDFYLDGQLIESKTVTDTLDSGKSLVVYTTSAKTAIFGSHSVKVMVSFENITLDTDSANNVIKSRFLVD